MEEDILESSQREGKRAGAAESITAAVEGKTREGNTADTEHRTHHSRAHKSGGGHKKSRKKSTGGSHKERSGSSSRRDSHSHARHTSLHQAETAASAGTERHAAGAADKSSGSAHSSSDNVTQTSREKTKSENNTKSRKGSCSAEGAAKDRSRRESCSRRKKKSHKEVGTEQARRSSSPPSSSSKKSSRGRDICSRDVHETQRTGRLSRSTSRSHRSSRGSSHHSSRCSSRNSSNSRHSGRRDRIGTVPAATILTKQTIEPPSLLPACVGPKGLLLGTKQELLPLPPLPKAAAAAAAALQEQCSKKKGQQAKAATGMAASIGAASPPAATDTTPGGNRAELVQTPQTAPCTARTTAPGASSSGTLTKPTLTPQQVRSSGGTKTAAELEKLATTARSKETAVVGSVVQAEAAATGAGGSAPPAQQKISTHTLQKGRESGVVPAVVVPAPKQLAASIAPSSKVYTAAEAECETAEHMAARDEENAGRTATDVRQVGMCTEENATAKTAARGTDVVGTYNGEAATKIRAVTDETAAAPRKTGTRRRTKVAVTGETRLATGAEPQQHKRAKNHAAGKCVVTVRQNIAVQASPGTGARPAAETSPNSVTESKRAGGGADGGELSERTPPKLDGATVELRLRQVGPQEEGEQVHVVFPTEKDNAASAEGNVQKRAAAAESNDGRGPTELQVKSTGEPATGIAAAGEAAVRKSERAIYRGQDRRDEESAEDEGTEGTDAAANQGQTPELGLPRVPATGTGEDNLVVDDGEKVKEAAPQQREERKPPAIELLKTDAVDHKKTGKQMIDSTTAVTANDAEPSVLDKNLGKCQIAENGGSITVFEAYVSADFAGLSDVRLDAADGRKESAEATKKAKVSAVGKDGSDSSEGSSYTEGSEKKDNAAVAEPGVLEKKISMKEIRRERCDTGTADEAKTGKDEISETEDSEEEGDEKEENEEEEDASRDSTDRSLQGASTKRGSSTKAQEDRKKVRSETPEGNELQQRTEINSTPQQSGDAEAVGAAQVVSLTKITAGPDNVGKTGVTCPTGLLKMAEEQEGGEEDSEEDDGEEGTPRDATADVGVEEEAASAISSLAASPSRYYSPSVSSSSKSSSPDSQGETTPKEANSAAGGAEEETGADEMRHRDDVVSATVEEETVVDTAAEHERADNAAPSLNEEDQAEAVRHLLASGSSTVSKTDTLAGTADADSSSGALRAIVEEVEEGTDDLEHGTGEARLAGGKQEPPAAEAARAKISVVVAKADDPAGEMKAVVADSEKDAATSSVSTVSDQKTGKAGAEHSNAVMITKYKLQQAPEPAITTRSAVDTETILPEGERRRQWSAVVVGSTRGRVWEEGLHLWKMLLRCEEVAYDLVHLRVLGSFACPRAEFVSVSSGCLGQPERAGDETEMLQQQEQLMLQFHALHSRLRAGMGRGGPGVGLMRRRYTRLQQALLSAGRRMEEELLQVNQLLQLQGLQHALQQQHQPWRRRSIDSSSTRRPSSTERATGCSQERSERRSGLCHRSAGVGMVDEDEPHGMLTGKGLLHLMSPSPLCWYVHDVVGMVCRRRSGGPFPERWAEYKEWCGDLVLDNVYSAWKAITSQRKKASDARMRTYASAEVAAASGRKPAPSTTQPEGQETLSECSQERPRTGVASSADAGAAGGGKQQQEETQKARDCLLGGDYKEKGESPVPKVVDGTEETCGTARYPSPASEHRKQTGEQQRVKQEEDTLEAQPQHQGEAGGADQKIPDGPAEDDLAATEQKDHDTRVPDGEGGKDADTGVGASVCCSIAGSSTCQDGEKREEQGILSLKKRKRTEVSSSAGPSAVVRGSIFCVNEEMVQHLVLLPCKAFLAERFFVTFPETKALAFGTANLKQRISAMRLRRSWRSSFVRVKQQQVNQKQPQPQTDEGGQEKLRLDEQGEQQKEDAKTESKTESRAVGSETLAPVSKQETGSGKTDTESKGISTSNTCCAERREIAEDQQRQQHITGVAKPEQRKTKDDEETGGQEEEAQAKKRRKGTAEGTTGQTVVATEVVVSLKTTEEQKARTEAAAGGAQGTKLVKSAETGLSSSTQQGSATGEDSAAGTLDPGNDSDLDPEVVAVINLCMTERYYPLPELRAQGIECYWLKVDGSGELPTEKVLCIFFRLLAFITHKYAKLRKQQREADGGLDPPDNVDSDEKVRLSGGISIPPGGSARVKSSSSGETAVLGGSSKGKIATEAAAGKMGALLVKAEETAAKKQKLKQEAAAIEDPKPVVDQTKPDSVCRRAGSKSAQKFTVLVQCTNGVNRTGLFTALLLMNLMGCDCNFALKTFSDVRGYPVTKDMFKKWLRSEEAKGLSKMYKQALQPPVLQGGVLAFKQRQQQLQQQQFQQQQLEQQRQHRGQEKEKDQQAGGQIHAGDGEEHLHRALKQGSQDDTESECQQHKQKTAEDTQYEKKNKQGKESAAAATKAGNTAAAAKGIDKSQKKKLLRKKQAPLAKSKGTHQTRGGEEQKQAPQTKKQKQARTDQEVTHTKKGEHQQESSHQAPEGAGQSPQQHLVEQQDVQENVTSPANEIGVKGHVSGEDLTIATPFSLITALEAERNFEKNLEARLSAKLENILAAREDERQRLLVAPNTSPQRTVAEKSQPTTSNVPANAAEHEASSRGGGNLTAGRGGNGVEGTGHESTKTQSEEVQVPEKQRALASGAGNTDADGAHMSTKEEAPGEIIRAVQLNEDDIKTTKFSGESEHHKATGTVDSTSMSADRKAAEAATDERPPTHMDARAPLECEISSVVAGCSQMKDEQLSSEPPVGDEKDKPGGVVAMKQGNEGHASAAAKDTATHSEALCAMEKAFQAEIEVVEELRLQAKLAVQSIPQLPPRLPLDGIVLVGPIQNSLLAPEELLLQLLAGCPSLKIESLDILVGHPVKKLSLDTGLAETTGLTSSEVVPAEQQEQLAEGTMKTEVAAKMGPAPHAAQGSLPAAAVERTESNNVAGRNQVQHSQGLYEPLWPESKLTYPKMLVPLETRKKGRPVGAEPLNERAGPHDGGSMESTSKEALLSRKKREREESSHGPGYSSKGEMHRQSQSGSLRKEDEDCSKAAACNTGTAAAAGDKNEQIKEGRTAVEHGGPSGAQTPADMSTEEQQRSSALEAISKPECSTSAAAVLAVNDSERQMLRTIQDSSGTPQPSLLHALQTLPKVGTLEVIEEEAEECLEEDDSPSCVGSSSVAQPAARLVEEEADASTSVGGENKSGSSSHTVAATTDLLPVQKKRRTEGAASTQKEDAQDVPASTTSAESCSGMMSALAAEDLQQQGVSACLQQHKDGSGIALRAVETADATVCPVSETGTRMRGSADNGTQKEDDVGLPDDEKESRKDGKHSEEEGSEQAGTERGKSSNRWNAVPERVKPADFSLSDLRRKGQGLFSQRELALRLLEYRDEDDLRLCYIARIQCADEASFVYLLSHRFQRMRQQPIHVYPSLCYPLLFGRGKRLDREILTHATAMVLAANATPPVTAAVQAVAAARKGEHHDFLWLLGCAAGAVKRGRNIFGRSSYRDAGERPLGLNNRGLPVRRFGSTAQAPTLDTLLPPLPLRPLHNCGRSPLGALHNAGIAAGAHLYEAVEYERGAALGRLASMPPSALSEPIGRRLVKPFFSSELALFGAAAAAKLDGKSCASLLTPLTHSRCGMVGGCDLRDPSSSWPFLAPFDVRDDAEEQRLLSQPGAQLYDKRNHLLKGAEATPPDFFYFADAARAAAQGRRIRTPGAATGSRVPAATRTPQGLVTPTLPGSALAAAAFKARRGTASRSNLAAHRRDSWLFTSRSRALSAGYGAAGSLPSLLRRSEGATLFCPGTAETPRGLGVSPEAMLADRPLGRTRRISVAERGTGRGGNRNEGRSTSASSVFPCVRPGMRQQRGFPSASDSTFRLLPPAPPLSAFFLRSPLPGRSGVEVCRTGPRTPGNAGYMGMNGEDTRYRTLDGRPPGMTGEMQQQEGAAAMWMSGGFNSRSGMPDESSQQNRGVDRGCMYTHLEGGSDCGGAVANSMSGRIPANPLDMWGEMGCQNDSRAGQPPYTFESQASGAGQRQDLSRGVSGTQGAIVRLESQKGERRDRSQQRAVTHPIHAVAVQRAPPPPPPLPGASEVFGRDSGGGAQGSWGESVNLVSAQHSPAAYGHLPGDNAGLRGSEQQINQQQYQQQQRATGAIAAVAGGRKGRVSGWTEESNRGIGGGREPQMHDMWGSRQQGLGRGQSAATGGVAGDANAFNCGMSHQQQGMHMNVRGRMQQEGAWGGAFGEERAAAGRTWSQPQIREGASISGGQGGVQPGWAVPHSEKAMLGVPSQHQLEAQQQQGMRGNQARAGRGAFGGTAEWGSMGNTIVSDAATRAAAALMAGQQPPQTGKGSCKGGAVDVWSSQGSNWEGSIGTSARGLKCTGSSVMPGGGSEHLYGRADTSIHRPFPGDGIGGTRSGNIDSGTAGRQVVPEAGGTTSGTAAGTTWRGNSKPVGICGQQKQQHDYFRPDQEQRLPSNTAGGSNTVAAMAGGAGAGFASGDAGGERGLLPSAEEADNSRGNARGAARVCGGTQAYGPPAPPLAPPSAGGCGRGEGVTSGVAHSPAFPGGRPAQGQVAADGSTIRMREGYAFPPSSGVVGAGRDPAGYGAEGGQLQSSTVADTGNRGGAAQDLVSYQGGRGGTAPDQLPQHSFNGGNVEYPMMRHGGPGADSWAQGSGGDNCTRMGPAPPGGRGGYGRGRTTEAEMSLPVVGGAAPSSGSSVPPYSGYPTAGRGSAAVTGKPSTMITGNPGVISSAPRGSGVPGDGYGYGSGSAETTPRGGAPPSGKAYGEGAIAEGRQTQVALRPAGAGEVGPAPGMGTVADAQQQFATRGGGTQGICRSAEHPNQGRGDSVPGGGKVMGGSAGKGGPGGPDGRRLVQRNGRRFNQALRCGAPTGGIPAMQRAHVTPPPVPPSPPGQPQWTIQRLFQAAGTPRPPASGTGVEQQQFGNSMSWENAGRAARGGAGARGMGPGVGAGGNEGSPRSAAGFTQQQQHNLMPKQRQADWGGGFGHTGDGSAVLWPVKIPPDGGMPLAGGGQQSSTQQQQQTALMIQFAQQLALMQQQQQGVANSAARGTSVDSLNVAANPLAGLIGSLQQGSAGLANSNMSQQQLQQQLLMMCMLHQQQQQQQAGTNAPVPAMSAMDLQQLMLYTQYYSMLLSGMSEQQATATVQAQQLLQRQQDEIVKQQLLHHSIQQQQQLQLSLAGFSAAPAASFSGLGDPCKGPPPT